VDFLVIVVNLGLVPVGIFIQVTGYVTGYIFAHIIFAVKKSGLVFLGGGGEASEGCYLPLVTRVIAYSLKTADKSAPTAAKSAFADST
jgi:hypothetical protein